MKKIVLLLLLLGCSPGDDSDKTILMPQESPIKAVGFTSSLVNPQRRFMGYSRTAGRVSVIDPIAQKEKEAYRIAEDYDEATPLESYSGIALLSSTSLRILAQGEEQTFPLKAWAHWGKATETATLAFSGAAGDGLQILKAQGSGVWQNEVLATPWMGTPSANAAMISVLSARGDRAVALVPSTGEYAVYESPTVNASITGTLYNCSLPPLADTEWTAVLYDSAAFALLLGNSKGALYKLDLTSHSACPLTTPLSYDAGNGKSIRSIQLSSAGEYLLAYEEGEVLIIDRSLNRLVTLQSACLHPLYPLSLSGSLITVICEEADSSQSRLKILNRDSSQLVAQLTLDLKKIAGASLDNQTGKVFVLRDSSLGILDVLDPKSGLTTTTRGLFLQDILSR